MCMTQPTYKSETLTKAVDEVKRGGKTYCKAANKYGIPLETLETQCPKISFFFFLAVVKPVLHLSREKAGCFRT